MWRWFGLACAVVGCAGSHGGDAARPDAARDTARSDAEIDTTPDLVPDGAPDSAADTAADTSPDTSAELGPALLPVSCDLCPAFAAAQQTGTVKDPLLVELSGLAGSRLHRGVFYATNDDDDGAAQFFALNVEGAALGRFAAAGRPAKRDTEEIAVGPCGTGSCVFLADVGDGGGLQPMPSRTEYAIFRLPEPAVAATPERTTAELPYERFRFAYPDGSHDAEAIVVDPQSGAVYVITKRTDGKSAVYALPHPLVAGVLQTATKVVDLTVTRMFGWDDIRVTAATAHPCGTAVLIRTYTQIFEYRRDGDTPFARIFSSPPRKWDTPFTAEAITYGSDGRSYVAAREGKATPVQVAACQ